CPSNDPACGITDCDDTGACLYPGGSVACGESCSGNTQTDSRTCDGGGNCLPPTSTTDCTPYACGPIACLTSCVANTGCIRGLSCDPGTSTCCSGLGNGSPLAVDSVTGNDSTACCGLGGNTPCQTLSHAMTLIDAAQAQNVMLNATVDGGGGDWGTGTEPS